MPPPRNESIEHLKEENDLKKLHNLLEKEEDSTTGGFTGKPTTKYIRVKSCVAGCDCVLDVKDETMHFIM